MRANNCGRAITARLFAKQNTLMTGSHPRIPRIETKVPLEIALRLYLILFGIISEKSVFKNLYNEWHLPFLPIEGQKPLVSCAGMSTRIETYCSFTWEVKIEKNEELKKGLKKLLNRNVRLNVRRLPKNRRTKQA